MDTEAIDNGIHEDDLTIEQLAARSGMSVRNIRAHQGRGLLSPPQVRRRIGYYGPQHLAQLKLIQELQREGFNLAAIKRLAQDSDGTALRLERFKEAVLATASPERPQTLTLSELDRRFQLHAQEAPAVLRRAQELGVLVSAGEGRFEAPSPSLLAVAEEVVAGGISLAAALEILADIVRHCDSISRAFVELFLEEVWKPFARAEMPPERWPEMEEAVRRLRPIASEALLAVFQQRLAFHVESAFREIGQLISRPRPESRRPESRGT